MAYEQSVLRAATERLERRRRSREAALEEKRREVYFCVPRVAEIDRELKGTVLDIIAAALKTGSDPVGAIETAREKNLSLQAERAQVLEEYGYKSDVLDEHPDCEAFGDTGWRGTEMCTCLKKLCAEEQRRELSHMLDLGGQSFDSFQLDYYSPLPGPGQTASPRENMELIYEMCLNYAQKFGKFTVKNLFLTGAPGLGKTFLSACIAGTVSEKGFSVVYDTAGSIFARFEAEKFARDSEEGRKARDETKRYLSCDLLILDDLGSEMTTAFVQSALYTLINSRLLVGKRTVISSNLSMDEVCTRYSPQIASRLGGEYRELYFYGEDIRRIRKEGR